MTRTLLNRTIMIVSGRSIATFRLKKDLEDLGASVCVSRLADAEMAIRSAHPDAVIIDFSIATSFEGLEALENSAIPHFVCRSPNTSQDVNDQALASQHIALALTELLARDGVDPAWISSDSDLDPELYAI